MIEALTLALSSAALGLAGAVQATVQAVPLVTGGFGWS